MIATMMSRFTFPAAVLLALLAGPALAQPATPAALEAAKELLALKGAAQMFDPVVTGVIEQTKGALLQTNPQLAKDLTEVGKQLGTEFAPRRAEIIDAAAKAYAARFSEKELKDVVAFYKTPAGQKMVAQEPLVLDDTFGFVQQWQGRIGEEVMNRFRAEMKKKGHNL